MSQIDPHESQPRIFFYGAEIMLLRFFPFSFPVQFIPQIIMQNRIIRVFFQPPPVERHSAFAIAPLHMNPSEVGIDHSGIRSLFQRLEITCFRRFRHAGAAAGQSMTQMPGRFRGFIAGHMPMRQHKKEDQQYGECQGFFIVLCPVAPGKRANTVRTEEEHHRYHRNPVPPGNKIKNHGQAVHRYCQPEKKQQIIRCLLPWLLFINKKADRSQQKKSKEPGEARQRMQYPGEIFVPGGHRVVCDFHRPPEEKHFPDQIGEEKPRPLCNKMQRRPVKIAVRLGKAHGFQPLLRCQASDNGGIIEAGPVIHPRPGHQFGNAWLHKRSVRMIAHIEIDAAIR
ncbi:MAG: hypothetical protein BWY07_02715 [Candidatus Hydrogenedentes bacterium ADurb.Bin170]|nr:MAG: hypothetical protein BWY07_02715 [Candidatus Hydrogenedentes bacterium ADurb.Bin170]